MYKNTEEAEKEYFERKIDLSQPTCPNREQRAGGVNIFYGKASELVEQAKGGCLKNHERGFQQTSGCSLNFYLSVRISTIRDAATIFHAPVGCSSSALGYRELYRGVPVEFGRPANYEMHWMTTNLREQDVVYGAGDKLKKAILEAERRYDPKAIFILTSCTTGIIGEDIEGVVADVQPHIKSTLVPVHCEGVRSRLVQTGYDAFWHAILKYLVKKPTEKQPDLVNVASMLSYTWQDRMEVQRLLGKVGLRANLVPEFATVEQFQQLSSAAVTAPLCPTYTDYISRGLEQEHGVPFFLYPSPMGFANTDGWLREIGKYTGKEVEIENLITEEHATWKPKLHAIRAEFDRIAEEKGRKLSVLGSLGQGRLLAQLPYFDELGIASPAAMSQDYDNLILEELEDLVKRIGDFDLLINTFQAAEQAHITRKVDPDLTLSCPFQGGAYKREKGMTRIHALRGDPHPWSTQSGYTGAVAYGNFLLQSLKSSAFQKTLKEKTADSYKEWFYAQPDPLYYLIKEAE